jgi:hypothetical protein
MISAKRWSMAAFAIKSLIMDPNIKKRARGPYELPVER